MLQSHEFDNLEQPKKGPKRNTGAKLAAKAKIEAKPKAKGRGRPPKRTASTALDVDSHFADPFANLENADAPFSV